MESLKIEIDYEEDKYIISYEVEKKGIIVKGEITHKNSIPNEIVRLIINDISNKLSNFNLIYLDF